MLSFFVTFIILIILGVISDYYICRKFIKNKFFGRLFITKSIILQLSIVIVILSVLFRLELLPFQLIMWLFVCYSMVYIPQVLFMFFTLCDFKRRFIKFYFLISALIFCFILYGVTLGRIVPRVELCEVLIDRLPKEFVGYKIVQLSDIHLGSLSNGRYIINSLVKKVNAIEPDMIVVTGDLVNLRANEIMPYKDILSQFKAKDGIYSILGNHDYGDYVNWTSSDDKVANLEELKILQKELGWYLLNNENSIVRRGADSIAVVGVENWGLPPFPAHGDLNKATHGLDYSTFKLLLSHNPTHWDEEVLKRKDIDLTLSGHTHAMQMKINFFGKSYSPASHLYKRWSGLYCVGEQYLYVNEGVGCVGVPMRIGSHPEITLIVLK